VSQRSVINLNFLGEFDYAFINHYLGGDASTGPKGSAFTVGTPWPALIDANGWPNRRGVSGTSFGGSVRVPASSDFSGPYVITWDGDGCADLNAGTWTVDKRQSSGYVQNQNGRWTTSPAGAKTRIVASVTGLSAPTLIGVTFQQTDPNLTGAYLKNFKFYRLADEADLLAGKVFRAPFKQQLANLCPSAIRSMNWLGGAASTQCRFENRALPNNAGYSGGAGWTSSPVYSSAVAGTNQYTLAAASPTASNPKTTPGSMQHGEIATAVFRNASIRQNSVNISAITNDNPGQVTAIGHPFQTGDKIVLQLGQSSGMQAVNRFPVTVTVVDTNNFTIDVNTKFLGTYAHESGDLARALLTLQVGSGNDRVPYPITDKDGDTFYNAFSKIEANSYFTCYFDKNCAPVTDGTYATFTGSVLGTTLTVSGVKGTVAVGQTIGGGKIAGGTKIVSGSGSTWTVNISQNVSTTSMTAIGWVYGAWIVSSGANNGEIPLEILTTLINEVNALGPARPIGLWLCIPFRALNSLDPDYSSGSDWALNAVSTVLNGANGFAGLSPSTPLYLEFSNETWNFGGGFWASHYLWGRSYRRWFASGQTDAIDMQLLLSTNIVRSVKAAFPNSNIKYILAGWGDQGTQAFGGNLNRINGSSTPGNAGYWFGIDPVSSGWGTPMTNYDAFATAAYFGPGPKYCSGVGFASDSALYATDIPGNQMTAISNFVAQAKSAASDLASGYTGFIDRFLSDSLTGYTLDFATAVKPYGKTAINYEGGPEWATKVGEKLNGGHTITAADSKFLSAITNSAQWRDAQLDYFNRVARIPNAAMPAVYTFIGTGSQRWSYCYPDTYQGGVEGAALSNNPVWMGMGARNQVLN
jgi:hypothetical protein